MESSNPTVPCPVRRVNPHRVPVVRALTGPDFGLFAVILPGKRVTLGRQPGSDLLLSDPGASRRHAFLCLQADGRFLLQDLASTNGTLVDGREIQSAYLEDGGFFSILETQLVVEFMSLPEVEHLRRVAARLDMIDALRNDDAPPTVC